jgi:DNA repair exonuclease SbcCD ATPase subunit
MKLLGAQIVGFGPYVDPVHLDFSKPQGIVAIIGKNLDEPRMSSNGSGKSMLPDAIEWCLFGTTKRGGVDSVVNDEPGSAGAVVTVAGSHEGKGFLVERRRGVKGKKDGVSLFVEGIDKTAPDVGETQARIHAAFGLDVGEFRSLAYLSQTDNAGAFADGTDGQRETILTEVLRLEHLDEYRERAETELGQLEHRLTVLEGSLSSTKQTLESFSGDFIASYDTKIVEFEAWKASALQKNAEEIQRKAAGIQEIDKELVHLVQTSQYAASQAGPVAAVQQALASVTAQLSGKQQQHTRGTSSLGQRRAGEASLQRELQGLSTATVCPTCGQAVHQQHLAQAKAQKEGLLVLNTEAMQKDAAALQGLEQEIAALQQQAATLHQQVQAGHALLETARTAAALLAEKQKERHRLVGYHQDELKERARIEREQNSWGEAKARAIAQREACVAQLAKVEVEKAELQRRRALVDFWATGFGSKGLRRYLIDAALDELNNEINRWLYILTGGTHWVRIETQTMTATKKKLSERFNIRVFKYLPDASIRERAYSTFSGGERFRLAISIFLGLARLKGLRSGKTSNVLWLDEVFQRSLDGAGKEAVAEVLTHLAKQYETIFVVEHDLIFQGLFSKVLTVEKKGGRSRVVS